MAAIRHTIVTGQSLAAGSFADPGPQANAALHRLQADGDLEALETVRAERRLAEWAAPGGYHFCVNTHAAGGTAYTGLKKGTATYEEALDYVQAGYTAALGRGDTFDVRAVHIIHGEQDRSTGTAQATYEANLAEWVSDYNTDVKAITGQSADVIGIACQLGQPAINNISKAQLEAHRDGTLVLVGPKYQLPYDPDGIHLLAAGYYRLGEYHGRVHREVVIDGGTWHPLSPLWIKRAGLVITAKFHVPEPPLALDTTLMPSVTASGFSVAHDGGTTAISTVELISADTVKITLATATGANARLRYGADATTHGGNLRDSSADVSGLDAHPLHNWCVQFDDLIPFGSPPTDPPPALPAQPIRGSRAVIL